MTMLNRFWSTSLVSDYSSKIERKFLLGESSRREARLAGHFRQFDREIFFQTWSQEERRHSWHVSGKFSRFPFSSRVLRSLIIGFNYLTCLLQQRRDSEESEIAQSFGRQSRSKPFNPFGRLAKAHELLRNQEVHFNLRRVGAHR